MKTFNSNMVYNVGSVSPIKLHSPAMLQHPGEWTACKEAINDLSYHDSDYCTIHDLAEKRGELMTSTNSFMKRFGFQIAQRDGFRCHYCGCGLEESVPGYNPKGASIDHVIAQNNGGSDDLDNLVLACRKCNQNKKTKHYQEFRFMKETDLMLMFLMGGQS